MKKLLKQIIIDYFLYLLIFLAIMKNSESAENILSFFIIVIGLLIALTTMLATSDSIKEVVEDQGKDYTSLSLRYYGRISTVVEVSIFASQGWYWMAGLWFTAILFSLRIGSIYDELYGKPKLI